MAATNTRAPRWTTTRCRGEISRPTRDQRDHIGRRSVASVQPGDPGPDAVLRPSTDVDCRCRRIFYWADESAPTGRRRCRHGCCWERARTAVTNIRAPQPTLRCGRGRWWERSGTAASRQPMSMPIPTWASVGPVPDGGHQHPRPAADAAVRSWALVRTVADGGHQHPSPRGRRRPDVGARFLAQYTISVTMPDGDRSRAWDVAADNQGRLPIPTHLLLGG
jgi:hypothetical protein